MHAAMGAEGYDNQHASDRLRDPAVPDDARTLALLAHLSALLHLVVPGVAIAAPIILYMVKKDESPFVADHAKEAIHFQISLFIYTVAFIALGFLTCGVGFALSGLVTVLGLIGLILGALAANRGEYFRYPMTLRMW